MVRMMSSRERGPMISTLLEETEEIADEEEEKEVDHAPLQQLKPVETTNGPTTQNTDSVTVRTLVEPVANARPPQYLVRRSSSAVERIPILPAQEEIKDGGDMSLRPRFLQERSATIVHITPQATTDHSSYVPRSKASAFLMDVLAKSRGGPSAVENKRSPLEPLRPGVTNTLHYVPPQGVERGVPLRMAGRNTDSRRLGHQVSNKPSTDLAEKEIPDEARKRRVSASQEHMITVVRALQASNQQLHQQLDILHSVLRYINANERDDDGMRAVLKEIVDVGMIPELAGIMREFRFHTDLQVCVMSILSALAEESHVYAYMMSEFNLEKLLQKTAAVHATEDRLIMLASNLVRAIENSKRSINIQAYQAEKAATVRRQSATYTDMLVAAITSKTKQSPTSPSSSEKPAITRRTCPTIEVTRSRALISSAPCGPEHGTPSLAQSTGRQRQRQRQAFALDVAPPALSANYRLLFSRKLKRSEVLPLQIAERSTTDAKPADGHQEKRDRPISSPSLTSLPLDLTSRSLATAIYSGGSNFVEPSPLSKRLPYRGSFSAGGVRRKLSVSKKIQRAQTERLPPAASASPAQPSIMSEKSETSLPIVDNAEQTDSSVEDTSSDEKKKQEEKVQGENEDEDEEESYEDDFDTTGDDSDGDKKMPSRRDSNQLGSDGELIDMLHNRSDQDPVNSSSQFISTPDEVDAVTTIQRHIRGVLVRREYVRPSRSASIKNEPGKKTSRMTNTARTERRGSKSEGIKGKRIPRAHRQPQNQGSSRRGNSRSEIVPRSANRVRPVTAMSPTLIAPAKQRGAKSKVPAQGNIGLRQRSQTTNNQLLGASRSSQLGGFSASQPVVTTEVEPEYKTKVVKEPPNPDALKQIQTLYAEGLQHHKETHLGLAIECYEKALAVPGSQNFASVHVNLGSALMAQNKFSEALKSFEQAKRIQPDNLKAIYNSSLALLHLDRPQEAQRLLRLILELEPSHEKASIALSHLRGSAEA